MTIEEAIKNALGELTFANTVLRQQLDETATKLKKLEDEKIVERREETIDKLSVSYRLLARGEHMLPVLRSIKEFAEKHLG